MIAFLLLAIMVLQVITIFTIAKQSTAWIDKLPSSQLIDLMYERGLITSDEWARMKRHIHESC